jgi:hypothetical protein
MPNPSYWWIELCYNDGKGEWLPYNTEADAIEGIAYYGSQDQVESTTSLPYFGQSHP